MTNRAECITAQNAEKGEKTMNETINHSAIFKELDRITRQLDFLNFVMPERIRNLIEAVSESKTTDLNSYHRRMLCSNSHSEVAEIDPEIECPV